MSRNLYLNYVLKRHKGFLIFSMIFVALAQFFIIKVFTGADTKPFLETVMKTMPQQFKSMMGNQYFSSLTIEGAVGFGLNHPVVLALFIILVISIASRNIAGEIEKGSMELFLSLPIKRTSLIAKLWVTGIFIILIVSISALTSSSISISIFDNFSLEIFLKILKIVFNLFAFMITIFTFSLMISTFNKAGSKVVSKTSILVLIFYFLDILSNMWKAISFIKPFNIFTYYQPQKLMLGERNLIENIPVLLILIIVFLIISLWQFDRRDIPG